MKLASDRRRPDVAADVVMIGLGEGLEILLVRRAEDPFRGAWGLPGVVCEPEESIETAARRRLEAMGGLHGVHVEQLHTFSDPGRDPRGWVISVAHLALVPADRMDAPLSAATDAEARWVRVASNKHALQLFHDDHAMERLAFDHDVMVRVAVDRLRESADRLAMKLLPKRFTLADAQRAFEHVLGCRIDKSSFRKRLLGLQAVRATATYRNGQHRPAQLYAAARGPRGG